MFDVGAAGNTILFFVLMVAQVMLGVFVLGYAAHCLVVVVESTAAGNDEVVWPDDPLLDWAWKLFYVVWLYGIWLLPAWILVKAVKPRPLLESPGPTFVAVACAVFWLLFPISLLSSLSATSAWVPFHWQLMRRLIRQARAATIYYGVSAALLAVVGWLVSTALFWKSSLLVPVAALVATAVFLIEARLLGRVAWLVSRTKVGSRKRPPKPLRQLAQKIEAHDPWNTPTLEPEPQAAEQPPLILPGEEEPVEGYGLASAGPPPVTQIQAEEPRPPGENMPFTEKSPGPRGPRMEVRPQPRRSKGDSSLGRKRAKQRPPARLDPAPPVPADHLDEGPPPPPPPRHPLLTGVYSFPWYPASLKAWFWLSLGGMVEGFLFRAMMDVRPPV